MEILIVLISELLVVMTITAMEALVMAVSLAGTILC